MHTAGACLWRAGRAPLSAIRPETSQVEARSRHVFEGSRGCARRLTPRAVLREQGGHVKLGFPLRRDPLAVTQHGLFSGIVGGEHQIEATVKLLHEIAQGSRAGLEVGLGRGLPVTLRSWLP